MTLPVCLSRTGSDRATAYDPSCKLLRCGDDLVTGWLDSPEQEGGPARIMLGIAEPATGRPRGSVCLAEGIDNHCGPALALDPDQRLHLMSGAHHGAFVHRWTDSADLLDPAAWSAPQPVGERASYPALVSDVDGTLHLACRESRPDRWLLVYRNMCRGRMWSPPVTLAVNPEPGYCNWMHSFATTEDGVLHLFLQFHYAASGSAADCTTYSAVRLVSDDGGNTWRQEDGTPVTEPVTAESAQAFSSAPQGGLRLNSAVLDCHGQPWVHVVHPDNPAGYLYEFTKTGPVRHLPGGEMAAYDLRGGCAMDMAFDPSNRLFLAFAANPDKTETLWFDPSHEVHVAFIDPNRMDDTRVRLLTEVDEAVSGWLPQVEDWLPNNRHARVSEPHVMWTRGNNLGGIGGNNANSLKTEVWLDRLRQTGGV